MRRYKVDKQGYKVLVSELIAENATLKDRLLELGENIKDIPNDKELGKKIRSIFSDEMPPKDLNQTELFGE